MKSFRKLSLGYFVALAAALLLSATAEAAPIANKAVVRAIRGTAQISNNKGQTWAPARVGSQMGANTVIRTGAGSSADLFLGENGPVVRVTDATQLTIDKLSLENTGIEKVIETQLDLKNGRILGSVKKMAAASKYEVKTPVGVAGIRGTEYSISSNGQVNVVSGTVVVVYVNLQNGQVYAPVTVQGGQQSAPPVGQNQTATVQSMTQTTMTTVAGEVTTVMVGITVKPDGGYTATLQNETGQNIGTVETNPGGDTGGVTTGQATGQATTAGQATTGTKGDATTGTKGDATTGTKGDATTGTAPGETTGLPGVTTTDTGVTTGVGLGSTTTTVIPPPDTTVEPISNETRTTTTQ